MIYCIS